MIVQVRTAGRASKWHQAFPAVWLDIPLFDEAARMRIPVDLAKKLKGLLITQLGGADEFACQFFTVGIEVHPAGGELAAGRDVQHVNVENECSFGDGLKPVHVVLII